MKEAEEGELLREREREEKNVQFDQTYKKIESGTSCVEAVHIHFYLILDQSVLATVDLNGRPFLDHIILIRHQSKSKL